MAWGAWRCCHLNVKPKYPPTGGWVNKVRHIHSLQLSDTKERPWIRATTWTSLKKKKCCKRPGRKEYTMYGSTYRIPENTNDRKQVIGCLGLGGRRGWDNTRRLTKLWGEVDTFIILSVVMGSQVCTYITVYQFYTLNTCNFM